MSASVGPIPATWLRCHLGDVVEYGTALKAEPASIEDDAWVLELEDIERDSSRLLARVRFAERRSRSTKNCFLPGDVLYSKLRPYLNKVLIADRAGYCTTEIVPIHTHEKIDNRFLFYWLKHPMFLTYVSAVSHGLNMPRLGTSAAQKAPFVLAPRNEQTRIADKLDSLFARVETCRDRLNGIPEILKSLRQSILADAISGRLTEDWRGPRTPKWRRERAFDVCAKVQSGGTPKAGFIDSPGIPFLKVYNIVGQRVDFAYRSQFVSEDVHLGALAKSVTLPGDVLMNIVGPPLGKVAVVPSEYEEWNINQAITLFRPSREISTGWLYYVLCSGVHVREVEHVTTGSAGQVNISLTQCREFIFPVPGRREQAEIVRRVERLLVSVERISESWRTAIRELDGLVPLLLTKAFRGELTSRDSTDEPADGLLARIKTSKEESIQGVGSARKKEKAKVADKVTRDSLIAIIQALPSPKFTFEDLRGRSSAGYDALKDLLFELIDEPRPVVRQIFDGREKRMMLERLVR